MRAVVPSGPAMFGFAPAASNRNTAARSPASAASSSVRSGTAAIETVETHTTTTTNARQPESLRMSDLRQKAAAIADRFHGDIVSIDHGHQQIREPGVLRILQMLAAFDLPVGMAKQDRGQRIIVMRV